MLLFSIINLYPHQVAKSIPSKAGVDTEIFKAHSVWSASTSAAATSGITTGDILKAADWSSVAVFTTSPSNQMILGRQYYPNSCHSHLLATNTCWCVRPSLLKYNYRMAQPTQWVPAILDYMKKARLSISTSYPIPPRDITTQSNPA